MSVLLHIYPFLIVLGRYDNVPRHVLPKFPLLHPIIPPIPCNNSRLNRIGPKTLLSLKEQKRATVSRYCKDHLSSCLALLCFALLLNAYNQSIKKSNRSLYNRTEDASGGGGGGGIKTLTPPFMNMNVWIIGRPSRCARALFCFCRYIEVGYRCVHKQEGKESATKKH